MDHEQIDKVVDLAANLAGKADDIEEVLVIYIQKSDGKGYSLDNGLTVAQANFLVDKFHHWLFSCMAKEDKD